MEGPGNRGKPGRYVRKGHLPVMSHSGPTFLAPYVFWGVPTLLYALPKDGQGRCSLQCLALPSLLLSLPSSLPSDPPAL